VFSSQTPQRPQAKAVVSGSACCGVTLLAQRSLFSRIVASAEFTLVRMTLFWIEGLQNGVS
jgi:hypothetical protein